MVIDGVERADRRLYEFVIAPGPQFRAEERVIGGDSLSRAGKKSEEGRPVVPGKVEAVIVFAEGKSDPVERVIRFPADLENLINASNGREEFFDRGGDDQGEGRIGKLFADRGDGGRREDQVADSLELEEKNVHFNSCSCS